MNLDSPIDLPKILETLQPTRRDLLNAKENNLQLQQAHKLCILIKALCANRQLAQAQELSRAAMLKINDGWRYPLPPEELIDAVLGISLDLARTGKSQTVKDHLQWCYRAVNTVELKLDVAQKSFTMMHAGGYVGISKYLGVWFLKQPELAQHAPSLKNKFTAICDTQGRLIKAADDYLKTLHG